ncbi:hypothetical protein DSUL_60080 [Desulfovibrionales bacterium]
MLYLAIMSSLTTYFFVEPMVSVCRIRLEEHLLPSCCRERLIVHLLDVRFCF